MHRAANGFELEEERVCGRGGGGVKGEKVEFHASDSWVGREEARLMRGLGRGDCGEDGDECNSVAASIKAGG